MRKIAVVIPAHNEEKVLKKTLDNLVHLIKPDNMYIRSDGSTDRTARIAKSFGVHFSENAENIGKTKTLKAAFKKYDILNRYRFVIILDADTIPDKDFFKYALKRFDNKKVACVCGQVETAHKLNFFVVYRGLMYTVWQNIYKLLSSQFNAITIAPGPASIYRSAALKKMDIQEHFVIEDFDMTFQIHRRRLGSLVYESKAKVTTQDPDNLSDYFKQITRWQLGFIQTSIFHRVPFRVQAFDIAIVIFLFLELTHAAVLFFLLPLTIWITFFALYPSLGGHYIYENVLFGLLAFDIWFIWGLAIFYSVKTRTYSGLLFGPFLWLVQYINIIALAKAGYLAVFKSVHGAWVSPTRR